MEPLMLKSSGSWLAARSFSYCLQEHRLSFSRNHLPIPSLLLKRRRAV